MNIPKKTVMGMLAPIFNAMLGIEPGHFGSSPRQREPGAGVKRARAREAAQRAAQKERLKHAAPPQVTRQQRRRAAMGRW